MDELELLKKRWQYQDQSLPHYKQKDLYEMIHKKSSSIVKWIFFISIFEFVFWIAIELFGFSQSIQDSIDDLNLDLFYRVSLVINYIVIISFIIKFFYNYRQIQTTDSIKALMRNIVKTRQTVKFYVWFNIIFFAVTFIISIIITLNALNQLTSLQFWLSFAISIVILLLLLLIVWLFYRLLYGILTRRLLRNYKNLKQIEL